MSLAVVGGSGREWKVEKRIFESRWDWSLIRIDEICGNHMEPHLNVFWVLRGWRNHNFRLTSLTDELKLWFHQPHKTQTTNYCDSNRKFRDVQQSSVWTEQRRKISSDIAFRQLHRIVYMTILMNDALKFFFFLFYKRIKKNFKASFIIKFFF